MKQEINLYTFLPKRTGFYLTKKTVWSSYGAFLLLLLMSYFVALWHKHQLTIQLGQLNKETSLEQQQLTLLVQKYPVTDPAKLKLIIQGLQEEYEKKAQAIEIMSHDSNFSAYLLGLGNAIVSGVWLTQITIDREENKLALKGYALNPALLGKFYSLLVTQRVFSSLTFKLDEIKQTSFPASFYLTAQKANNA